MQGQDQRLLPWNHDGAVPINHSVTHMVSLRRDSRMMKTLTGQLIAEATILRYVKRLHRVPARHPGETSLCVTGTLTLKVLHPKPGIKATGVIPRYGSDLIHDCPPASAMA